MEGRSLQAHRGSEVVERRIASGTGAYATDDVMAVLRLNDSIGDSRSEDLGFLGFSLGLTSNIRNTSQRTGKYREACEYAEERSGFVNW